MIIVVIHQLAPDLVFLFFVKDLFGFVHDFMQQLTTWIDERNFTLFYFFGLRMLEIFYKLDNVRFRSLYLTLDPILIIHVYCKWT